LLQGRSHFFAFDGDNFVEDVTHGFTSCAGLVAPFFKIRTKMQFIGNPTATNKVTTRSAIKVYLS
jgi:hypothetical protein